MRRGLVAAAVAALLAAGCRTSLPPAVPLAPEDPRPVALLASLGERGAELQALRGLAKLSVEGPEGSLRSKQVLVVARPARLRVEVLGFLSQTVALLATDGETYDLFQVKERRFERAPVHPGLLWEVAGIALAPDEAVRVLLGAPDLEDLAPAGAVALPEGGVGVLLADAGGSRRRGVEFDSGGALRRLTAWRPGGLVAWDVRYDDVEERDGLAFAHQIALEFPATGVEAEIDLDRVELNPSLGSKVFELEPPPGVRISRPPAFPASPAVDPAPPPEPRGG